MPQHSDLEVDTEWIRRTAATLDMAAARFLAVAGADSPTVSGSGLGGSAEAQQVAVLVGLRCGQAGDAAVQLGAVSQGLATRLQVSADQFDRAEQAVGTGPR